MYSSFFVSLVPNRFYSSPSHTGKVCMCFNKKWNRKYCKWFNISQVIWNVCIWNYIIFSRSIVAHYLLYCLVYIRWNESREYYLAIYNKHRVFLFAHSISFLFWFRSCFFFFLSEQFFCLFLNSTPFCFRLFKSATITRRIINVSHNTYSQYTTEFKMKKKEN